ncbi:SGNH/GDSL hydrolase family protein [Pontibacillus salicampi]|uniref:SGNH/GDSL hydrolase family protein n=1 Tax=Pontibacillus salicampi TaxID=1449801 RepID=A0ABV6LPL5_9BACI
MKHKIVRSTVLLVLLGSILTGALYLYGEEKEEATTLSDSSSREKQQLDKTEQTDEKTESNDLTGEIKEAFSNVLEGARGLFLKEDLDIVTIGDSLTQGVGDQTNNEGYVGIMRDTLQENENNVDVNVKNYGKRGNRTDQMLKRLEEKKIKSSIEKADLVLITIGANDIMKIVKDNFTKLNYKSFVQEQKAYKERLRSIFTTIREQNPEAKIYLIGLYNPFKEYFSDVPELGQIVDDWNNIGRQVVQEYDNTGYIPILDAFERATQSIYAEDNFHPNQFGYKIMAQRVLDYIKEDIEKIEEEKQEKVEST